MGSATELYRSQIGGASVINYSYTDFPWKLVLRDIRYFFVYSWALPWILWPIFTYGSGELDELYPTWPNLFCVAIHGLLFVLQLAFLLVLPVAIIFPLWMVLGAVTAFMLVNSLLCTLLNGPEGTMHSDEKYAKALPEHAHEQWVFINGVAVGEHWLQNNLNRLAITFKRPILGIHNRTYGIIFDVIECLIQRNLSYATDDVRIAYKIVKNALYDPAKSKVVLILHSQGGLEGSLVLDWLLQEMPQDLLSKLEIYTFGCAANHFNNPHRHAVSQKLTRENPSVALGTVVTETSSVTSSAGDSPVDARQDLSVRTPGSPSLPRERSSTLSSSTRRSTLAQDRAIAHIEHYAHSTDFVSLWGILHFATNRTGSPLIPRFLGRLFVHSTGLGGHQMNQHYLNGMFPLRRDPATGELVGVDEEDNEFMDEVVKLGVEGGAMDNIREAFDITYAGTQGFGSGEVSTPVEVHGVVTDGGKRLSKRREAKVRDLSRLWSYRNGMSPQGKSPLLVTEGSTLGCG